MEDRDLIEIMAHIIVFIGSCLLLADQIAEIVSKVFEMISA